MVQLAASLRGLCESSRKVYAHLPATSASKIAQPRTHLTSLLAPQVTVYGRLATCCQDGQDGLFSNWMHGLRRASLLFMFCAALPAIFSRRGVRVLACCSFAHGHHWCLCCTMPFLELKTAVIACTVRISASNHHHSPCPRPCSNWGRVERHRLRCKVHY